MATFTEPTDLDFAMMARYAMGVVPLGPLTLAEYEREVDYLAYCIESEREHELESQNGGRTRCPACDEFGMEHRTVSTGYDLSDFAKCRNCGHEEFAG